MENSPFSPGHAARARRYQMRRLGLGWGAALVDLAVTAAFLALFSAGPLPEASRFLAGAAFFGLLALARETATLPLDYLAGFRLPHLAGLSNETLKGWWADRAKGLALLLLLGAPVAGGFLEITAARPAGWWWIAGGLGAGLGMVLALIGPVLLAPLFFRFRPLSAPELAGRLRRFVTDYLN